MIDRADDPVMDSGVISTGEQDDVREGRRRQVERLVASGMGADQRCEPSKVGKAALYCWMPAFKESESDVFGGYDTAHAGDGERNRYEHVRKAILAPAAIE